MPVVITITGENAEHALAELIGFAPGRLRTPAVSDVSSDTAKHTTTDVQPKPDTTEPAASELVPAPTKRRGRPAKLPEGPALNVVANISTSDEREPPTAETVAETVAVIGHAFPEPPAEETKVYTLDDARHAAKPYILKYTMAAAAADLQSILEESVGVRAISKINPNDQAQVKKAIDALAASVNTPGPVALKLMADEAAKKAATEAKVA